MTPQMSVKPILLMLAMAVAVAVMVSGCASGGTNTEGSSSGIRPSTAKALVTAATSLPLQAHAVSLEGDPQPTFEDVTSRALTDHQARELAEKCKDSLALVQDQTCREKVLSLLVSSGPCEPGTTDRGLCGVFSSVLDRELLFRIIDQRPGEPLCANGPGGLCFQTSVQRAEIPPQFLNQLPPLITATPSDSTSPSETDTTITTENSSSTGTSSESPSKSSSDESPSEGRLLTPQPVTPTPSP